MTLPDAPTADVAERLLAFLRQEVKRRDLRYEESPSEILGGYEMRTFGFRLAGADGPFTRPLIMRLYRRDDGPKLARFERTVQNSVADQGLPAPRVLLVNSDESKFGAFIVMERIAGTPLIDLLRRPSLRTFRVAGMLAETQANLHNLDTARLRDELERDGLAHLASVDGWFDQLQHRIDQSDLAGLRAGLDWARQHRPDPGVPVICHGDYHPNNLLVDGESITGVIDWSLAKLADPEFDVGNTRVLLTRGPRGVPAALDGIVGLMLGNLARRYHNAYRKLRPIDEGRVRYYEAVRCLASLVWAGEHRVAASTGMDLGPNPWSASRESKRLINHFYNVSGIRVALSAST